MKKIHTGFLKLGSNSKEDDILFLDSEPLAEKLDYLHRKFATVQYYISDKKVTLEQAQEKFLNSLFGQIDVDYTMQYSETSGYLWTDEEFNVGGHNLLQELKTYHNKYLILIVDIDNPQEKEKVYHQNVRSFKMHLNSLDRLAKEIGQDRNELIKKIDQGIL